MKLYLVIVLSFFHLTIYAQKNSFEISRGVMISRLHLNAEIEKAYERSPSGEDWYAYADVTKPVVSSQFTYAYARQINETYRIGVFARQTIKGLRSSFTFNNVTGSNPPGSLGSHYGGYSLEFKSRSIELGTQFSRKIYSTKNFSIEAGLDVFIDVHHSLRSTLNHFERHWVFAIPNGGTRTYYSVVSDNIFSKFGHRIENRIFRVGVSPAISGKLKTGLKGVYVHSRAQAAFLTRVLSKDRSSKAALPDGTGHYFFFSLGLGYEL